MEDLRFSGEILSAIDVADRRLLRFESKFNLDDSHRIYSCALMDLELLVEECEFEGRSGFVGLLGILGEEQFRNDYHLDEDAGLVGSFSPMSLSKLAAASAEIDWSGFVAAAEREGGCEVPVDVLVGLIKDLVEFLKRASSGANNVVFVHIF